MGAMRQALSTFLNAFAADAGDARGRKGWPGRFADWWCNPPLALFDPSRNLMRVTVRGPTSASELAFVSVGPNGLVLIFR